MKHKKNNSFEELLWKVSIRFFIYIWIPIAVFCFAAWVITSVDLFWITIAGISAIVLFLSLLYLVVSVTNDKDLF